jgi:hypothetical protein
MSIRYIIPRAGSFDSELSWPDFRDNSSTLTIVIRLYMQQVNPPAGQTTAVLRAQGGQFDYQHWRPTEWTDFCRRIEAVGAKFWNRGMCLIPPFPLPASVRDLLRGESPLPTSRTLAQETRNLMAPQINVAHPFIRCKLDLRIADTVRGQLQPWSDNGLSGTHVTVRCYRFAAANTRFRSYVIPRRGRDIMVLNHDDYLIDRVFGSHCTVAHEIAHLLGLDHPGGNSNANWAYGLPGSAQQYWITGRGSDLATAHAQPWLQRIREHTGVQNGWRVVFGDPYTSPNNLAQTALLN